MGDLALELEVNDQGKRSQIVYVTVLGSWDLFEVATGEFSLPTCDNLQVCGHPIIFGSVFSIDLTHYK